MVQAMETANVFTHRSEYLDAASDEALLDSIDPSLSHTAERLHKCHRISQIKTLYEHVDRPARRTFVSNERHTKVSAELIAERFGVGPIRAQRTLRVTRQQGVRSAILLISRRYRAVRVFNVKRLNGKFSTNTAYGKVRLLRSNIGCQLYSHKCVFKVTYPMQKIDGNHIGETLTQFINDYGVREHLTFDGASVQTGPKTRFMDAIQKYEINTMSLDRDNLMRTLPSKAYMRSRNDGIVLCLKGKFQRDYGTMDSLGYGKRKKYVPTSRSTQRVEHPSKSSRVIRQAFQNIWILNSTIGSCTYAMQALEKLNRGVGSVSRTGLDG
jgi:hypothetical protein